MNNRLRRILRVLGILVGVLVVLILILVVFVQLTWDRPVRRAVPEMNAPTDAQTVARGEYLFKYSLNCWDCHGSQGSRSIGEPQAGGFEFELTDVGLPGGFGVVYASNITADPETGIGSWSDGELVRALREGLDPEGYQIFPIMEAEWWRGLSDEDTLALVAYMRTLTPVRNEVPRNRLTFVAKALFALGVLKAQPAVTETVAAPPRGATVEYGEYLAYHASSCVGCHMPRNPNTGQFDLTRPFAGGLFPIPDESLSATGSNLTPDPATGIGNWTEDQFITAMRTGLRPDGTVMVPYMPWPSYSRWNEDDLRAVWLFLRSLEPITHEIPPPTLSGTAATAMGAERGESLFNVYCVICHGEKGSGSPFTSIALKEAASSMDEARLSGLISEGFGSEMPGFNKTLTDEQIADLVTFINTWQ